MADSEARVQRAAAMEEKRRRLEEMRQRRARRDEDTAKVKAQVTSNLDEYIDGLLSQPSAAGAGGEAPAVAASKPNGAPPPENTTVGEAPPKGGAEVPDSNVIAQPAPAPPPKNVETFTVGTQTEIEDVGVETEQEEEEPSEDKQANGEENKAEDTPTQPEEKEPKVLTEEEIDKEIASTPFSSFINTASKKVERVLGTPLLSDLLVDYVGETDGIQHAENKDSDSSKFVSSRQVFECAKWTEGRDVTDMDWSPLHRELILSTYHMPMSGSGPSSKGSVAVSAVAPNGTVSSSMTPRSGELQSDGLALVWSLTMPTRPEHIFTCGSPVTAGRFHPTESPLVIGGCESGQLVVWDVRAGRLPVQKSALTSVVGASSKGHTQPIGSMEIIEGGVSLDCWSSYLCSLRYSFIV